MNIPNYRWFGRIALAGLMTAAAGGAFAQPEGTPARILVGFPAGGSFDAIARLVADKARAVLNRPVLVDNKPGAGGRIVVDHLKAGPTDGSVVMFAPDLLFTVYPFTYRKLNYDPQKDLVPVGAISEYPYAIATGADPKVNNWAEYVNWARKNPSKVNYGTPSLGSQLHFLGLLLGDVIGVPMLPVSYQGSAPIAPALMGGHVSAAIDTMGSLTENHKAGKIRVLAVSSEKRMPQAPDVPTFAELGVPRATATGFNALYAPAGTPPAAVAAWNKALVHAMSQPDVREKLINMGFSLVGQSPEELVARQNAAAKHWEPLIRASGFKAD